MSTMTDNTQSALSALRNLQPADRAAAAAILSMWARRDEIDIQRVVDYYFAGGGPASSPETGGPAAVVTTEGKPQADLDDEGTPYGDGYAAGYLEALAATKQLFAGTGNAKVAGSNIVDDAIAALAPYRPDSREQVVNMLLFWRRRAELTAYDIEAIQDRLFPIKLIDPPACPTWCDGTHGSEDDGPEFRDCTSEGILFPVRTELGMKVEAVQVNAIRSFDKRSGKLSRPLVELEDYDLTAREARALAVELARVADLIDGGDR